MKRAGLRDWAGRVLGRRVLERLGGSHIETVPADPLLDLGALLCGPVPDVATLNALNGRIDPHIRSTPERAAHFLQSALYAYTGPRTPLLDRLMIQTLEAEWRRHSDQAEKGRALRKKLHLFEAQYGPVPATVLYRGALALRGGRREEAFALLAQSVRDIGPTGMPWMYVGAHGIQTQTRDDWLNADSTADIAGTQARIDWYHRAKTPGPVTLLAGGDSAFFRGYGPSLHTSLRARDTACTLHFHIVNMTAQCAQIVDGMRARDPALSVSTETYPHADDRTYFASARFYRLGEIRAQLPQPTYITDLDNIVTQPVVPARAAFGAVDAAWHSHASQTWFPWWGPSAANTYIGAGAGGETIAQWMRAYLAARFRPGHFFKSWWIDQLMLNEIDHAAQERGLATTTSRVPALTLTAPMPDAQRLSIRQAFLAGDFAG